MRQLSGTMSNEILAWVDGEVDGPPPIYMEFINHLKNQMYDHTMYLGGCILLFVLGLLIIGYLWKNWEGFLVPDGCYSKTVGAKNIIPIVVAVPIFITSLYFGINAGVNVVNIKQDLRDIKETPRMFFANYRRRR